MNQPTLDGIVAVDDSHMNIGKIMINTAYAAIVDDSHSFRSFTSITPGYGTREYRPLFEEFISGLFEQNPNYDFVVCRYFKHAESKLLDLPIRFVTRDEFSDREAYGLSEAQQEAFSLADRGSRLIKYEIFREIIEGKQPLRQGLYHRGPNGVVYIARTFTDDEIIDGFSHKVFIGNRRRKFKVKEIKNNRVIMDKEQSE